jgi:acetyl/propionyl-CoA carboxylase alpha subunit/acetyl-CoA carboxylase carboxyltransferase component
MDPGFSRLAIVNRGEAAMRLIHAAREYSCQHGIDLRTIALHTSAERGALFVCEADEAVCFDDLPPTAAGPPPNPYLDYALLEQALAHARADAVWPGWGFVAEHADFAARCEEQGITFLGPTPDVMRRLGDKIAAKLLAEEAGVPVAPWSGGAVATVAEARHHAGVIGYPLVIKATAGGGGRGIRLVTNDDELEGAFDSARAEAARSFGDPTVFMERQVRDARHVEVQIIADGYGTTWALGVRDCSIQRRNQKVIEESRSTVLSEEQQRELRAAAERLCARAGYRSAGTVEFLYQPAEQLFAFLEVNTRLQVEHPVTELTTGLDLVKLQLHIARGGRLTGEPPTEFGHAIEARLNAEDPRRDFAPSPGTIDLFALPTGPGIRIDTGVTEGDVIPPEYDSMIAKVIVWGHDRDEARSRLQRTLLDLAVVVRGGMTNKSFLLDLLATPEVISGEVDTGWLDRSTTAELSPDRGLGPVAVAVAAIDAYEAEAELELARFLASASRGRPEAPRDLGQVVELTHAGASYTVRVAKAGPHDWFRLAVDGNVFDVVVERLARFRSRLVMGGRAHRIVSWADGAEHVVEVDGKAHRLSRDDGGLIRAPAAAVVVAVLVAPDDVVSVGTRLAVVEAMKMEVTITAPMAGRVRDLYVAANVQVEAGAALLRLEPVAADDRSTAPTPRLTFAGVATPAPDDPRTRCLEELGAIAAYIEGFDLTASEAQDLLARYGRDRSLLGGSDEALFRAELAILSTFADVCGLTRNRREGTVDGGDAARSPREYFRAYLHSLDADREGLPDGFRAALVRAVAHYGIPDLEPGPTLNGALHRIFLAHQRGPSQLAVVLELLDRLEVSAAAVGHELREELRETLDRLIVATQLRYPVVGNLARTVRFRCFDQPLIDAARDAVLRTAREHLAHLAAHPDAPDRAERLDVVVASPQPLLPLLSERIGGPDADALLVEVLTRRYYKVRPLEDVRTMSIDSQAVVGASYVHSDRRVHIIALRADLADLARGLAAAVSAVHELSSTAEVVLDVYVDDPDGDADVAHRAAALTGLLDAAGFPATVVRVAVAVCHTGSPESAADQLTFLRIGPRFAEQRVYRGLHPMIARRLHLWRLANFDLERLPSAEDVVLFDCTARENPSDERLIAFAEVRDLTPVRDSSGQVTELPELEQVLAGCLDSLRVAVTAHPAGARLAWNRVHLYVWPPVETPIDELLAVAARLAPITDGLGLDQVVVQCRVPDRDTGDLRDLVIRVGVQPGTGLTVRMGDPPVEPLRPLDEYTQKVIQSQRRGAVYPYELVPLVAGEGGTFTELDLDDDGVLRPVVRDPGQNQAGIVVGTVRTPTARYPEGMLRVAVFGDPTKALGSIAEPECRRLLAAIDLADEQGVPIEWFALSAGARIAMNSGSENLDWVGRVLRRLVELTHAGGEVNIIVAGINVGAQPYWNAEATMLMHTRGILVMTPDGAMVLTGKQALDYAGGVSAEDNLGLGGYERIMGPNGQAQYWAPDLTAACAILLAHYEHAYVAPGERFPRRAETLDRTDRDVRTHPHTVADIEFTTVGDVFSDTTNRDRKKAFDMRTLMRATIDSDHPPLERWAGMGDADTAVVFDAHLGGHPVTLLGIESRPRARRGALPADGPAEWSAGTLFPLSSKKVARAINAASGNRPVVILANLSGFDGSPESLRRLQLEYGAEIGSAVVRFDGPIVLCVVSRYHGGAFVVFSATLNDDMEVLAVEGSFASVIGGSAAAAVVFAGEVGARTQADPRVATVAAQVAEATGDERAALRTTLAETTDAVRLEMLGAVGAEFDAIHSVERALEVGSVHRIIPAAEIRPALIDAVERGIQRTLARRS